MRTPEQKKQYWRDYYLKHRVLKKKTLVSRYRWKSDGNGSGIPMHIVIAETVLGKPLPKGALVHHFDGNGHNNEHTNLVVCPSQAYHMLLHVRQRALDQCGNANWIKCVRCGFYDDPQSLYLYTPKDQKMPRGEHMACNVAYKKRRHKEKRRVAI